MTDLPGRSDHLHARQTMVADQLRRRGIADERVLEAMGAVPRHLFLPDPDIRSSYADHPLPIGSGQTISQPYMVALMTEALRLTGSEKVLEIGTGSGYQSAVLAELARHVYSVERFEALADRARAVLADLAYENVTIICGDGSLGYPAEAPYDRILVTAAAPEVAGPWVDQLTDGGLLVAPIGGRSCQTLTRLRRRDETLVRESLGDCIFVPLVGEHGWTDG